VDESIAAYRDVVSHYTGKEIIGDVQGRALREAAV
jgi:hypothetical protein